MHGGAGNSFVQDSLEMQPSHQANRTVWLTQDPQLCFLKLHHHPLHLITLLLTIKWMDEWDAFWRALTSADPFSGDCNPC